MYMMNHHDGYGAGSYSDSRAMAGVDAGAAASAFDPYFTGAKRSTEGYSFFSSDI